MVESTSEYRPMEQQRKGDAEAMHIPRTARNVSFHAGDLPERYRSALQHPR